MSLRDEKPVTVVPPWVKILLAAGLVLQCAWHAAGSPPTAAAVDLPEPPPLQVLRAAAFGEPELAAKLLMLWLQAFDNQPGISIPYRDLNYATVIAWLSRILSLDPSSQYPLLAASRLYAEVPDPQRQRQMLRFVQSAFAQAPNMRWQWMAHAVYIAKHRLGDLKLALQYANDLVELTSAQHVPDWARQMRIFVLEDLGEVEAAKILLGGLIESGEVTDPAELRFLHQRLAELEARSQPD